MSYIFGFRENIWFLFSDLFAAFACLLRLCSRFSVLFSFQSSRSRCWACFDMVLGLVPTGHLATCLGGEVITALHDCSFGYKFLFSFTVLLFLLTVLGWRSWCRQRIYRIILLHLRSTELNLMPHFVVFVAEKSCAITCLLTLSFSFKTSQKVSLDWQRCQQSIGWDTGIDQRPC